MHTPASRTATQHTSRITGTLVLSLSLMLACVSDSTSPHVLPRRDAWNVVAGRSWTVPAGADSYKCHVERLTSDRYITGFRVVAPPAAQARVTLSVVGEASPTGDFDCSGGAVGGSEMIYASGAGTDAIEFPTGEGLHVAAGQSLLLVVHLFNSSSSPVSASTQVEGRAGSARDVHSPIEMFLAGSTPSHS
jgi:hypothetical protein